LHPETVAKKKTSQAEDVLNYTPIPFLCTEIPITAFPYFSPQKTTVPIRLHLHFCPLFLYLVEYV
ncbi:MAG TPA: hypothetical protein IAB21_04750, partial [Candidatus Avelusimicrobium excrementipullorum]|nr:hypothetical protein [Candidatus Avelusimicrobium excrementipullorum]